MLLLEFTSSSEIDMVSARSSSKETNHLGVLDIVGLEGN